MSIGILRGMTHDCPHDVENSTPVSSNPEYPTMRHAVTTAFTWLQVCEYILEPHAMLSPCKPPPPKPPSKILHRTFLEKLKSRLSSFARHGEVLYSMQYAFNHCRSGIFVSVRNGKMQLFVPFCNAQYVNTWSDRARHAMSPSRTGLPTCHWWMNGWMLCDEVPEQVWGDHWVTTIRNMVRTCCVVDCDFIINKRDCPMVRKDCGDPMNPFDPACRVVDPKRLVRFFSFYGGPFHLDVPCPIALDWCRFTNRTYAQQQKRDIEPPFVDTYWESKEPVAVFRGALTGTGQRARFCAQTFEHADVRATSSNNGRRRVDPNTLQEMQPASGTLASRQNFLSMNEQQCRYKYGLLLNGHSAADRFARLFNGSQVVFVPQCDASDIGRTTWFSDMLFPMQHYVPVKNDGSDLDSKVRWIEDNPAACADIRKHCEGLPLSYDGVKDWWFYACC